MNVHPYSYLVIPFNIVEGNGTQKFKEYHAMLSAEYGQVGIKHSENNLTWIPGRVFREKIVLFREQMAYSHFQPIFDAFACNKAEGNRMPDSSLYVLNLQRYGEEELFDQPLTLVLGDGNETEFAIHNMENSFDAVKMIVNINASVGLIVIPIATKLTIDEFQRFIYLIRGITKRSIKQKDKNEDLWSIQDKIREWMSEFEGCYSFTVHEAQHLSFFVIDKPDHSDAIRQQLLRISRSQRIETTGKPLGVDFLEVPNQVLICSAMEGTAIMTIAEDDGIINEDFFKKVYSTEQTERYIVFMSVLIQRYALISIVNQLTKLGEQIGKTTPAKRSGRSPKERFLHPKDTLLSITSSVKKMLSTIRSGIISWWNGKQTSQQNLLALQREHVKTTSIIRIENYFSRISEYTIYNEFYQMCSKAYGITMLYKEIEQKMSMLSTYLTQQSDDRHEKAEWQLSIILAILTVTSATNDISQLSRGVLDQPWLFIVGLIFAVTICFYIFRAIFKNMR
ncbi:MAG: hypothetical protein ACI4BA_01670 [Prevotella sp.]